jgi:hypothetical protein
MNIPDLECLPILDPGVKKAPDFGPDPDQQHCLYIFFIRIVHRYRYVIVG